jgi:hypothetical protein
MKNQSSISCPDCGCEINVNEILKHQIEDSIRIEFQQKEKDLINDQTEQRKKLEADKLDFNNAKEKQTELFNERVEKEKKIFKQKLEKELKAKMIDENLEQIKALNKELEEKSSQVKELNKSKAEIERLKREKSEMKDVLELKSQKQLNITLQEERIKIIKLADEKNELKIKEMQKRIDDQKKLTDDMKRKQEQGSMQMQGEVQELAIEEWLAVQFPLDSIEDIKKGANGADCLQIVHTREMQNCGSIYYESKRTKNFSNTWIEKFKNDIREKNASIGVLVTEVLPIDMDRMGLKDGIYICTLDEFKSLSAVLRQSIIGMSKTLISQENKGDKMVMLYDFLTSNEFRLQMEGIVEGFTQMQFDLAKEKNAMKRIWKTREKQIDKVIHNTINMYGAIKGIAGNAVQSIQALELGEEDIDLRIS